MIVHSSAASDFISVGTVPDVSDSDGAPLRTRMLCLSCVTVDVRWLRRLPVESPAPSVRIMSAGEGSGK